MKSPEKLSLVAIVAAYYCLAVWYGITTPILEPYDEPFHFAYVLSIALDRGLPVQDVEKPGPWGNEGSQPPLYYVLAALGVFWTAEPGFAQQIERNPYTTRHLPVEQDDNRNVYVHRRAEQFPYRGNVLAIHLARLLSAVFGAGAVLSTYLIARRLFPASAVVALGAAAFHAFIPSFIYVTGAVSNDGLTAFLASLSLWGIVRVLTPPVSARSAVVLGVLVGLAVLAKLSALPLAGIAALAVFWSTRNVRRIVELSAAFGVVTGWWFARNLALYGELLGTSTMNQIAGLRPASPTAQQLVSELLQIERTFWAAFGTGNVHPDGMWLWLPRLITLVGVISLTAAAFRARQPLRHFDARSRAFALTALWMMVFLGAYAWWFWRITSVTGRLLFPVLTPFCLGVVYGVNRLSARRPVAPVALCGGAMFVMSAAMPVTTIAPAYAWSPVVSEAQVVQVERQPDVTFDDLFLLRAVQVRETTLITRTPLHVDLYWQALRQPKQDYTVYLHVLGDGDRLIGGVDTFPARGAFPASDWTAGQIYKDTLSVYLDVQPDEPVAARLLVGWYETRTQKGLPPRASDGRRLSPVIVGRVRVPPAQPRQYQPSRTVSANFGNRMELIGYDVMPTAVTLYWRAQSAMAADFTVFVHALDANGKLSAQADAQPRGGNYPTSFWQAGDIVRDVHSLPGASAFAAIRVGVYHLQTGARLGLVGREGDALELK